jgi:hypothetical protein
VAGGSASATSSENLNLLGKSSFTPNSPLSNQPRFQPPTISASQTYVDRVTGQRKQVVVIGTREELLRFAVDKGASVYSVPQPSQSVADRARKRAARLAAAAREVIPAPPRPAEKSEKFGASLDRRIREARAKRGNKRRRPAHSAPSA